MFRLTQRRQGCGAQSRSVSVFVGCLTAMIAFAATAAEAAPRLNPEHVLREWSKASQAIVAVGKSARQRAFHEYDGKYNGHQIALLNEFKGPVDADELLKRYRFTKVKRDGQVFRLAGVPRDDVEGLFVAGFEVAFSDDSFLPISVQFVDGQSEPQGDSIALLTSKPQAVTAVFDRTAVKRGQTGVRVASAVDDAAAGGVRQADVEFPVKRGEDSKRLQEVLNKWKAEALRTKTLRAKFRRFDYHHIARTEQRCEGTFIWHAPDKGRFDCRPTKVSPDTVSQKVDEQGNPYQIEESDEPETFIWWKDHCCIVKHGMKEIEFITSPLARSKTRELSFHQQFDQQAVDSHHFWRPFFGVWSPRLETDFVWTLEKDSIDEVHLKGVVQLTATNTATQAVELILDPLTFRPRAVKRVGFDNAFEYVYVLHDVMVNVDPDAVEIVDAPRFEVPKIPGYQRFDHPK